MAVDLKEAFKIFQELSEKYDDLYDIELHDDGSIELECKEDYEEEGEQRQVNSDLIDKYRKE